MISEVIWFLNGRDKSLTKEKLLAKPMPKGSSITSAKLMLLASYAKTWALGLNS